LCRKKLLISPAHRPVRLYIAERQEGVWRRCLSSWRGETVLVVDDANEWLLADEEMLAALGYEPVGLSRAGDALTACRAVPKRFDVLVVGHLATTDSALDLATALHETVPDLPILLATASADKIGADALVAAGISLQFGKIRSVGHIRSPIPDY
jgi:CheY-like chemotaxis protein